MLVRNKLGVVLSEIASDKINFWVHQSKVEISGFGKGEFIDGNFHVYDVYLLEQEVGPAHTDIDPEALGKLMFESREAKGHLNYWWHSHVDMPASWSTTDIDTIEQIGKHGLCVATVFNKKGVNRSAVYAKGTDFQPPVFIDDLKLQVYREPVSLEVLEAWKKEMETKCRKPVFVPVVRSFGPGKYPVGLGVAPQASSVKNGNKKTSTHIVTTPTSISGVLLPTASRGNGYIHPACRNLRWCEERNSFIQYHLFFNDNGFIDNVLDLAGTRITAIEDMIKETGEMPYDDDDIEIWYMEKNNMSVNEFYLDTIPEPESEDLPSLIIEGETA